MINWDIAGRIITQTRGRGFDFFCESSVECLKNSFECLND